MIKKDIKNYLPLGSSSNTSEQLPSLNIPEYKHLWCANYTHKIGVDANLIKNSRCDLHKDNSNDLQQRKTPKVQLMTELLSGKVSLERSSMNAKLFSPNIMPMESDRVVAPMDKSIKISEKERNMFQERSKAFNQNKNVTRSSMEDVVTNSCPGDNGYDREQCCLQSGKESVDIKHASKKDSGVCRRKYNQQAQVASGCSLQILLEGKNSCLGTNGSGASILIQPSHASSSIEKVQCHNNKSLHTKNHSDLNKLLEHTNASSYINGTSHPENELYLKQKLCQTLSSFMGADTIQRKNIPYCPLTLLKGDNMCYPLKANRVISNQSIKKGVIPIVRQPIVVQSDQSRRNGLFNLNRIIDLNYKQEIHVSPNPLQPKNHQFQTLVDIPLPRNKINLNEMQDHSNVAKPQSNQQPMKPMETGPSTYVPIMGNMDMFKKRHEMSHPQTQNGELPCINPVSTIFHPFCANDGSLRGSTAMTHVKEQPIKLSNSMQVSSHVSTRWRLQNIKKSNPEWLSIAQKTTFQPYNLQNNCNHENHKLGQASLGSLQKGKTISDLKSVNPMRVEDMSTKGMRSFNPFSSEGASTTQLSKCQERPFTPYNIHPSLLLHGNPSISNGFSMPYHQFKESSGVYMGSCTEVQSSRQHVSYFKDQGVSLGSQEKKRKAHALEQLGKKKLQQSAFSTDLLHTTTDSNSKIDLNLNGFNLPIISFPKKDPPCLLNQNPIDIADAEDERYFRTAENQRIRDMSSLQEKFGVDVKFNGRQRKRRKERPGRMSVVCLKR